MSLQTDVENELLYLIDPEVYGASMVIDTKTVNAIFAPDDAYVPGSMPGQIVERRRLVVAKSDLTAVVGNELTIDGAVWHVVAEQPMQLITNVICERYFA